MKKIILCVMSRMGSDSIQTDFRNLGPRKSRIRTPFLVAYAIVNAYVPAALQLCGYQSGAGTATVVQDNRHRVGIGTDNIAKEFDGLFGGVQGDGWMGLWKTPN